MWARSWRYPSPTFFYLSRWWYFRHATQKIAISSVQERNRADPGHITETGIFKFMTYPYFMTYRNFMKYPYLNSQSWMWFEIWNSNLSSLLLFRSIGLYFRYASNASPTEYVLSWWRYWNLFIKTDYKLF